MGHPETARFTLAEFLAWEDAQEWRHEFVDGEVFAMVGATRAHNILVSNLEHMLRAQLRPRGCQAFHEGIKLLAGEQCFYPDVIVTCARDDTDPRFLRYGEMVGGWAPPTSRERGS